ncbi:SDR family NAD(P)-dependent oxidoreductase [Parasphingorhabdus sp.]|uniref:SDR family NAD(P)-dependent oxidoreductase n=1 Tax=Parasphingorhabdus sp. TaxID=2709688 RepID=UPI003A8EB09C
MNLRGAERAVETGYNLQSRAVALHLSAHNSGGVAVNDYHLDRAETVAEEIRAAGGKAIAVQSDVTDLDAVKDMVAKIKADLGPVGTLINNAGNMGANPTAEVMKPFWEPDQKSGTSRSVSISTAS